MLTDHYYTEAESAPHYFDQPSNCLTSGASGTSGARHSSESWNLLNLALKLGPKHQRFLLVFKKKHHIIISLLDSMGDKL